MKVCIDSVIDTAKFNLGLRDSTYADADLERLINQAALGIDAVETYIIVCETLEVDCHKAKLPDGFLELICLNPLTDSDSNCCNSCITDYDPETDETPVSISCNCFQYYFASRSVLTVACGMGFGSSCGSMPNVYDIQNGYLVFPTNFTPTEVKVWYRSYNMDENGLMFLDETWERGLAAYASWKYASAGMNIRAYLPQQVVGWQKEWTAQVNKIRGKSFQLDHRQHKDKFGLIARAILLNPATILNNNI